MQALIYRKKFKDFLELSQSFVNGIMGDYLEQCSSTLAIKMQFFYNKRPIKLNPEHFKMRYNNCITPKIVIFIHGLCANNISWRFGYTKYGFLLQKELGYIPLYLRYNTGLHISDNGKNLSNLINELLQTYPININEIMLIGHSMGGLVLKSSLYYGNKHKEEWINKVKNVFFIGSPHNGSFAERLGNKINKFIIYKLKCLKNIGNFLNLRSNGIKDCRYGYITEKCWKNKKNTNIPFLKHINYFNVLGMIRKNPKSLLNYIIGDSLVKKNDGIIFNSDIPKENQIIIQENHLSLLYSHIIYDIIKEKIS